ncbi:BnaCnng42920D [Brassica napus]|uniref:BnaC03g70200D protein n=1 Tax=Brassica napus TaxID=3708 RepID=A0A078HKK1_BRANA|nr:BnaC03g70200D [Brassica napus]CDY37393.1 BnaC05g30370D [Brassica napus]CDY63981.1 BnaCnng42920D [Brassica napus]
MVNSWEPLYSGIVSTKN